MIILYYKKGVYGKVMIYASDPTIARHLQTLTGKKTIDENDMASLTALGVKFKREFND